MTISEISPSFKAAAVTKSDTTLLTITTSAGVPQLPKALYIGGAGDVAAQFNDGTTVTFSAVPVGTILPIRPQRVMAATTASLIVALY